MSVLILEGPGNRKTYAELADVDGKSRRAIRHAWFELGKDLRQEANQEILRKPKGGRTYFVRTRGGRRRRHVASAPGETHANLTGTLRRSLSWKVSSWDSMQFGYGVGGRRDTPRYAAFVEFGTRRMAARPSLSNAIDATQSDAERSFNANMDREFNE